MVPEVSDSSCPIEKYEVYGPRIFSHTGSGQHSCCLYKLLAVTPMNNMSATYFLSNVSHHESIASMISLACV